MIKSFIVELDGHDCVPVGDGVPNTQNCITCVFQGLMTRNKSKPKQNKTKQKSSQEITVKDQRASQVSPAKQLEEISHLSF